MTLSFPAALNLMLNLQFYILFQIFQVVQREGGATREESCTAAAAAAAAAAASKHQKRDKIDGENKGKERKRGRERGKEGGKKELLQKPLY